MSQVKKWTLTINNPGLEDHLTLWAKDVKNYGFQYEKVNTYHLQGWILFNDRKRLSQVIYILLVKKMHPAAHWEVMKGSIKQNEDYCSKSESSVSVYYTNCNSSKISASEKLKNDIENDDSLKDIFSNNFVLSCRYHNFITKYQQILQKPRDHETIGVTITGPTGTGKTGQIRYNYDINDLYFKPHGPWWDGYTNQPVVVFDEFYSWYPYGELLRVLDRYPLKVPIKGGFVEFNSEIVYFTSNQNWTSWFPNIECKDALERRLKIQINLNNLDKDECWHGPGVSTSLSRSK
ncbi:replication-associated protein [Longjawed orbweaver circular virus 2]|uniref:replication-associated protein n=1 Tax=Longjawed orbweaver circular virus 2 TaxID=2293295 RepID=UPI000E3353E3|nr:replication-associated protein [Longjawed orbweaver circular virus 2]AXL65919.1 replication-associated protein [Longjawed orbweaver circular virus 2]